MLHIYDPWLTANKLTLNKSKTEFLLIGSRQKLNTFNRLPSFTIDCNSIKKISWSTVFTLYRIYSLSARPRRFRLFNAHSRRILERERRQVKIPLICFGRDSINYHADLLSDDLARNTFPSPWALTIRPKIPELISGNFHGLMVQSFSSVKTIIVRLEFFNDSYV